MPNRSSPSWAWKIGSGPCPPKPTEEAQAATRVFTSSVDVVWIDVFRGGVWRIILPVFGNLLHRILKSGLVALVFLPSLFQLDLASAPVADPAGNKAQIRFSRKTKEQYVLTEVARKATGWKAFYRDGAWVVESSVKKRRSAGKKKTAKKTALKKTSTAVKRTGKRVSGRKRTMNLK